MIGQRLGAYEVLAKIGAGGMGEVYRARDGRLDRDVAIKILPLSMASDSDRVRRFEQEARAAAAINHPNILAVHDVGAHDGICYLVSELLEGETLRGRIESGALPPRRAIDIAVHIAHGLAAAHERGIVHRDLKPENVFLTTDGRVKILDFGLAKLAEPTGTAGATMLPAGSVATSHGMVLGTVGYMAPEQVRGEPVDHRADIFACGVVLYEMVTGTRAFSRSTAVETMTAILNDDPPALSALVKELPPTLEQIVGHCLEKRPQERFQSARDFAFALQAAGTASTMRVASDRPVSRVRTRAAMVPAAAVVAAVLVAIGYAAASLGSSTTTAVAPRHTLIVTEEMRPQSPRFSPDGKSIAYVAAVDGLGQIFTRRLDSPTSIQMTTLPQDASLPFWAPDQSRIYFVTRDGGGIRELWLAALAGGPPQRVLGSLGSSIVNDGIALSPDGGALAVVLSGKGVAHETLGGVAQSIWISSPPGAPPRPYSEEPVFTPQTAWRAKLRFSPDGRYLLAGFMAVGSDPEFWLLAWPDAGREPPRRVLPGVRQVDYPSPFAWMPDGRHIVLSLGRGLARHLWLANTEESGVRLAPLSSGNGLEDEPDVAKDGSRIVYSSGIDDFDIVQLPLDGSPVRSLLATRAVEHSPDWSPRNDQFVYVTDRTGREELWIKSRSQGSDRALVTPDEFPGEHVERFIAPSYSPDGARVVYVTMGRNRTGIWISPIGGGSPLRVTADGTTPTWSPDGAWIAYRGSTIGDKTALMKVPVGGTARPIVIREVPALFTPRWSPSGEWITIRVAEGFGIVSPDGARTRIMSTRPQAGERYPHGWSPDGTEIFITYPDNNSTWLAAIDVRTGAERRIANLGDEPRLAAWIGSPNLHLSITGDGRTAAVSVERSRYDLRLLEGFGAPRQSWWVWN